MKKKLKFDIKINEKIQKEIEDVLEYYRKQKDYKPYKGYSDKRIISENLHIFEFQNTKFPAVTERKGDIYLIYIRVGKEKQLIGELSKEDSKKLAFYLEYEEKYKMKKTIYIGGGKGKYSSNQTIKEDKEEYVFSIQFKLKRKLDLMATIFSMRTLLEIIMIIAFAITIKIGMNKIDTTKRELEESNSEIQSLERKNKSLRKEEKANEKANYSNLDNKEVYDYLNDIGYSFSYSHYDTYDYTSIHTSDYNKSIAKMGDDYYSFHNENVNSSYWHFNEKSGLSNYYKSADTREEEKKQEYAFKDWLTEVGLTEKQIVDVLDWYCQNKGEVKDK